MGGFLKKVISIFKITFPNVCTLAFFLYLVHKFFTVQPGQRERPPTALVAFKWQRLGCEFMANTEMRAG